MLIEQCLAKPGRTGCAITFASQEFWRVPTLILCQKNADDIGDGIEILFHSVELLGIFTWGMPAEAGGYRIDEDKVSKGKRGLLIIDDLVRRRNCKAFASKRDALRTEGAD